jgi:hypothetical protein
MLDNNNGSPLSAEECYNGFANNFGITYGYYHGGMAPFIIQYTPFNAVINLKTGIVMERDSPTAPSFQNAQQIITLMKQAAQ